MTSPADSYSLVADVGGTNTRVALTKGAQLLPDTITRYSNAKYPSLEAVLGDYVATQGAECASACVALAGPVANGRGSMTNLSWNLDEADLARATKAKTAHLLNDLQAQGHALGHLPKGAVTPVMAANKAPQDPDRATKLVIGIGTGFNLAPVYETGGGRHVPPSESGHMALPAHSEQHLRLAKQIAKQNGFASVEDVLSGRGIEQTYAFLGQDACDPRDLAVADIMARFEDGSDPRAQDAAQITAQMMGVIAGNLALSFLPLGGIFFSGGVARAFAQHLIPLGFKEAFYDKGRFADFMTQFEVGIIEDDYAALTGCAQYLASLR